MKKSFQTKESEFAAADRSEMSGVLSLIPSNSYVIVMRRIYKTLACPQICRVGGKQLGVQISRCLSRGIFVEKKLTKGVLMVMSSTCKKVEILFFTVSWFKREGGDFSASLQTPSWPPHVVILLEQKKSGRLAGIALSTSFSPKSMSYSEG